MEVLLGLILIPLGIALILAPVLVWVNFFRTRRLNREVNRLSVANKALSDSINRLETRADELQTERAGLRSELRSEQVPPIEPATAQDDLATTTLPGTADADTLESPEPPVFTSPEEPPEAPEDVIAHPKPQTAPEEIPLEEKPVIAAALIGPAQDPVAVSEAISANREEADKVESAEMPTGTAQSEPEEEAKAEDLKVLAQPPQITEEIEPEMKPAPWTPAATAPPPVSPEPARPTRFRSTIAALAQRLGAGEGDWETRIGQNWLNILGIIILVVGLVLLIQQSLLLVTPAGKIMIGVSVAIVLMGCGAFLRRRERYRVFAFTLIGGGWGLLYFAAFAAYNVEAAKIIENAYLAMVVLLAVAAGIIVQSFAYGRQSVTGLAYGLAFLALHLSPLSIYSLVATAVLAATIPFVVHRTDWRRLGVVIAIATYATHARWLWATGLAASPDEATLVLGGLEASTAFWANIAILAVYWAVYCATAIAHRAETARAKMLDFATSVINMAGFLGLATWQMQVYLPGNLHYLAPPAVVAYIATAIVDGRLQRPILSRLNGTIAIVLFAVALPLAIDSEGWSWNWLAPYWTLGALVVWEIARITRIQLYRALAYVLSLLALSVAASVNLAPDELPESWLFLVLGLAPVVLFERIIAYLKTESETGTTQLDALMGQVAVIAVPLVLGLCVWSAAPDHVAGLIMLVIGMGLIESGTQTNRLYLRQQGYLLALAGGVVLVIWNIVFPATEQISGVRTVLLIAAALAYTIGLRMRGPAAKTKDWEDSATWVAPAFATLFAAAAAWHWMDPPYAALAWILWAMVLSEAGQRLAWWEVRAESYILLAAGSFLGIWVQPEFVPQGWHAASWQWTLLSAALLHGQTLRMLFPAKPLTKSEQPWVTLPLAAGLVLFGFATNQALTSNLVPLVWATWGLLVIEAGQRLLQSRMRAWGYLLMGAAAVHMGAQLAVLDIVRMAPAPWTHVMILAALYHVAALRIHFPAANTARTDKSMALAPLLLGVLCYVAATYDWLPQIWVPVAWALWALVVLEAGQRLARSDARVVSYLLLGAAWLVCGMLQSALFLLEADGSPWWLTLLVAMLFHLGAWRVAVPAGAEAQEIDSASVPLLGGGLLYAAAAWTLLPAEWVTAALALWAVGAALAARRLSHAYGALVSLGMGLAAFGLGVLLNVYEVIAVGAAGAALNWLAMSMSAAGLYGLHAVARKSPAVSPLHQAARSHMALHLGTLLVALMLWKELPSVAVAVAWAAMAWALIELAGRIERAALSRLAQVLILAAVIRLFFANFTVPGETFGLSHRLVTVGAVIALVYYMRALRLGGWGEGLRLAPSAVFSWIGAALLVLLARFEVGREFAVAIWSVLILVFAMLGTRMPDLSFRQQSYVIAALVFARAWATNAQLKGTLWGMSERVVTTLPSLVALLIVVVLIPRGFEGLPPAARTNSLLRMLAFADRHARTVISMLFAVQLTLLIYYEMTIDLVSIGWAVSALFLIVIGFALNERSLRLFGLLLLMVVLLKVVFVDLEGVETIYRVFSFIVLGLVLLLASLGYSRLRDVLGRYL